MSDTLNQHDLWTLPLAGGTSRFEIVGKADERVTQINQSKEANGLLVISFEGRNTHRDVYLRRSDTGKWSVLNQFEYCTGDTRFGNDTTHSVGNPRHGQFHGGYGLTMTDLGITIEAYNRIWSRNGTSSDLAA